MSDNPFHSAMIRLLAARPAAEFFGRAAGLERLRALAEMAARGMDCAVAVEGPPGSGKSELLRQLTLALGANSAASIPVYLDLPAFFTSGPYSALTGEARMRESLFRALLRQALIGAGSLDPADLQWLESDPARLAGYCYGAGLGGLAPLVSESARQLSFVEAWRGLLAAWRGYGMPGLILVLDGAASGEDPAVAGTLGLILESARREGCPVFFEAPADPAAAAPVEAVERFTLGPLAEAEALALAQRVGQSRGWTLPPACLEPVLERLGPWPGWVRAWAMRVRPAPGLNPVRAAEEAYLEFLSEGPWAEALRRRLERLIPLTLRDQALRLLGAVLERDQVIAPHEAPAMLGLGEAEAERVLAGLTRLGLLGRRGSRWGAPHTPALADWARLAIAEDARDPGGAAARVRLLGRLLTQPRPSPEAAPAAPPAGRLIPDLLARFRGQMLPAVLFHFADYYEALGKMAPERRREAVARASAAMRLPETIGVAEWRARPGRDAAPIWYARAYRDGKYQRSHEEIWIAVDLSAVKMLTTPEITAAFERVEALEATLRPGRFTRWLILGEGASAEALDTIKSRGFYCSSREQLAMIQEMASPPAAAETAEWKQAPAVSGGSGLPTEADAGPVRHSVIELRPGHGEPRCEVSSLRLPARDGNELIAALAAEKIAIRSDFDPAAAGQIKTAVLEGVLNAIEHSLNPEKIIDIQFALGPEALEVLIENEGPPFDPLAVPAPDPQAKLGAARKRGWGLSLMKRFMDEVGYEPCERGTRLRLVKKRKRPASAVEGLGARG